MLDKDVMSSPCPDHRGVLKGGRGIMSNPLLEMRGLPPFEQVRPVHAEPAVRELLAVNRRGLEELLKQPGPPTWERCLAPLEEMEDRLARVWSVISHLHAVADSEELRAAYGVCLELFSNYQSELEQHEGLCKAVRTLRATAAFHELDASRRRVVDNMLRDFRLAGVQLRTGPRRRLREIRRRLSELQMRFEQNVLDATHGWYRHCGTRAELEGLPPGLLALAQRAAQDRKLDGWVLTLEQPCYLPAMKYLRSRELRRELYEAHVTRASERGPRADRWDNTPIMYEILALRREQATLLEFPSFAHYSLERKMADSPREVLDFLHDLAERAHPRAEQELEEVRRKAAADGLEGDLEAWDLPYYSERLRRELHALDQEALRSYFPVERVLSGLFRVFGGLFGIDARVDAEVPVWHPDVLFYRLYGEDGAPRGGIYLDLYARPHKRGGAWMDECIVRRRGAAGRQQPVAYLTCNFTPALDGRPPLLTHEEVITLFHEFGHSLHHLLTRVDCAGVSGINGVPWDAVEFPSQLLEFWGWDGPALAWCSAHVENSLPVQGDLLRRLRDARTFQAGLRILRQLEFAVFDMRLHLEYGTPRGLDLQCILNETRSRISVFHPPEFNRFQNSFAHIFAGGYAAGYYSYLWAEVLAADAFSRFEETGTLDAEVGRSFLKEVLEQGGVHDPRHLFRNFRGRAPRLESLLRYSGLLEAAPG